MMRYLPLISALLLSSAPAFADDTPLSDKPAKEWLVTLGGITAVGARYPGASDLSFYALPWISYRRVGQPAEFFSPDDGFDVTLFDSGSFSFGPVADLRAGRTDNALLKTMGARDLPWGIDAGVFAEFWPIEGRLRTRVELRQGLTRGNNGAVADFAADWVSKFDNVTFALGPRLSLGDSRYMRNYFASTTPLFVPKAGVKSVGAMTSVLIALSPRWSTTVFTRVDRLIGAAGDSPLVMRQGSRWQTYSGVGVAYTFSL
ncbi:MULTISPECIES: MipA/OmpV family protein [unclassified Beijerinckia]|uniref:MipA/OmpV family protein n=1 Tax=unclassified Beijerinckia TaxID=2638183 RepID=UPI00089BA71E|nr:MULTISPECIES: MipA/OmpV family protein [unclassified Beijerinckia]MDH7795326.1 outer membrane protein [Beijerinckia sp. GAS462]SEB96907.1 Outer membrane scaffolding protein for murein synthesis, MipA/OmpV family [Beijerinckia sp. 28-YEA-48]